MMKTLFMIGGTMGVGKTTVCQQLKRDLQNSVFLDGDWCWDASPFQVTDETKSMVTDNICYLLNNFLHCSAYENVIFCWVMHQQATHKAEKRTSIKFFIGWFYSCRSAFFSSSASNLWNLMS